jgi:UDP-N-acetylmuramyl pentapeptide phosphotransferase/UDP-N-acetylglucosamine-1-phosphate transferase
MNQTFLYFSLTFFAGFICCLGLTERMRIFLLKRAMLDIPNFRSAHKMPVPRGGGIAFLVILVPGLMIAATMHNEDVSYAGLIAAIILLASVSWLDDRHGIHPAIRLSLHVLAAWLGSLSFSSHDMLFNGHLPLWCDRVLMIVGWAWFINLYNFMDGIDGITCMETIALAAGAGLLFTATGMDNPFVSTLCLLLISVSLGFLALNWYPARIFMGDVGSVPLGFLSGFVLLVLAVKGHPISALILPLYYLADSGITITKRALRGEKIWQAHCQHFYQIAAAGVGRHEIVVYRILVADIGLIAAAVVAVTNPGLGLIMAIALVGILLHELDKLSHLKNGC